MFALLHQYLINYSSLNLPGIGIMQFANVPARFDNNRQQIYSSTQKLSFIAGADSDTSHGQQHLMAFLSNKLDLPEEQAHIMFHHFLDWAKSTIATKNILHWDNIGEFHKTENNTILFILSSDLEHYLQPVSAKESGRRLHSNYAVLVGGDETTSLAIEEQLEGLANIKRNYWWIWAIAIAAISGAIIASKYLS